MQSWAPLKEGSAFSGAHTPGAGGNQNQRDPGKMERGGGGGTGQWTWLITANCPHFTTTCCLGKQIPQAESKEPI